MMDANFKFDADSKFVANIQVKPSQVKVSNNGGTGFVPEVCSPKLSRFFQVVREITGDAAATMSNDEMHLPRKCQVSDSNPGLYVERTDCYQRSYQKASDIRTSPDRLFIYFASPSDISPCFDVTDVEAS